MIDANLQEPLFRTFENLSAAKSEFIAALNHADAPYIWLPSPFDRSENPKISVAKALTRFWYEDRDLPCPPSGILCCDADMITAVTAFNDAKADFQTAVQAIVAHLDPGRKQGQKPYVLAQRRDEELAKAMANVGINRLNLTYVYQKLLLQHAPLHTVSWSYNTKHTMIRKYSFEQALKLINAMDDPLKQAIARDKMSTLQPNTELARISKKRPQLVANTKFIVDQNLVRKTVKSSSILLSPSVLAPTFIKWPDAPDQAANRLSRCDTKIFDEPFISALNLHLYRD
jgi:hypothetical protein